MNITSFKGLVVTFACIFNSHIKVIIPRNLYEHHSLFAERLVIIAFKSIPGAKKILFKPCRSSKKMLYLSTSNRKSFNTKLDYFYLIKNK